MKKEIERFPYEVEVLWRVDSYCYKINVAGEFSLNAEGCRSAGWSYARFLNVLQSGISMIGPTFLENDEYHTQIRNKFFEKDEPEIMKAIWNLKDVDLGIKSVILTPMSWSGKEEIADKNGWAGDKNRAFEKMYPQTAELCLDDDQEIEA